MTDAKGSAMRPEVLLTIIVLALVSGVIIFAVVALVFTGGVQWNTTPGILGIGAAACGLVACGAVPLIRRQRMGLYRQAVEPERRQEAYFTATIIPVAVAEGAAFLNLIAFFIEGHIISLVSAGVLVAVMILLIPRPGQLKPADLSK